MQAQMERARRGLSDLRRYWWGTNTCHLFQEEKIINKPDLDQVLLNWDSRVWQACVLGIWDAVPIKDPRPYCALLANTTSVKKWLLCAENDSNNQMHVHLLALTSQRSDAFKRTLERVWFNVRLTAMSDIEEPDPSLEIVKCQKCHKPSSLIAYMAKDPEWIAAHDLDTLQIFQSIYAHDLGERFRAKQELEKIKKGDPSTANMHTITAEITDVIMEHNCKSVEDCMRAAPEVIAKHLHRAGLATIIQNCISWVTSTGGGWSMASIGTKYPPHPDYIHIILLHQGIVPSCFDEIFYKWITKQDLKKNTIVLWGPTNTGKSAFISGLKTCINWGEVVNSNTFAFEGLINTQMGIWEEPLISPELAEKAKQIFEGMETSIPVKYRKPTKLTRIPIIMTTNHAPWRFCTKEEEMFKNRMHIFSWLHNMHNTPFTCRASEYSCQCRLCQTSRGSTAAAGWKSTGGMPGEKQPLQQLVQSAQPSGDVSTRSLPVFGKEIPLPPVQAAAAACGGDSGQSTGSPTGSQIQCTNSPRPSCSTGAATLHGLRPSGEHRPSHSRVRNDSAGTGVSECVESIVSGRGNGDDSGGDSDGSITLTCSESDSDNSGGPRRKRQASEEVVVLGNVQIQKERDQIPTTEHGMGGEMGALTIPTRLQWLMYLSYLQNKYG
uniref:Nonstructural protein 1 n=1 Tax=Hamaparvovirinae sp. TaxID=2809447 RepID=A0AAU7P160_9VIRU